MMIFCPSVSSRLVYAKDVEGMLNCALLQGYIQYAKAKAIPSHAINPSPFDERGEEREREKKS